jgi:diguanylate cyclase (GGDEF)-like protein
VLSAARFGKRKVGVLILDVERLSVINDSLGRTAGDSVLRSLGRRLIEVYGAQRVAQISGGTYPLVVEAGTREPCEPILRGALALFDTPFRVDLREVAASARVGAAFFPRDATEAAALMQKAESALYAAREHGDPYVMYDAAKHSETLGCFALEHKLRLALRRREFRLEYQPKVRTMVSLAGALRMTTVAEGVESVEQCTALQRLGCDQYQGYYHSRPMPLGQLMSTFRNPPRGR